MSNQIKSGFIHSIIEMRGTILMTGTIIERLYLVSIQYLHEFPTIAEQGYWGSIIRDFQCIFMLHRRRLCFSSHITSHPLKRLQMILWFHPAIVVITTLTKHFKVSASICAFPILACHSLILRTLIWSCFQTIRNQVSHPEILRYISNERRSLYTFTHCTYRILIPKLFHRHEQYKQSMWTY
jgi:hypothetical protein